MEVAWWPEDRVENLPNSTLTRDEAPLYCSNNSRVKGEERREGDLLPQYTLIASLSVDVTTKHPSMADWPCHHNHWVLLITTLLTNSLLA